MNNFVKKGLKLIIAIFICQCAGIIGSLFTTKSINTWYQTINKPIITPPGWVFGPVWISLYFLMGIAIYLIWIKGIEKKEVKFAMILFFVQLTLNATWSISFFGMKSPLYGLINIFLLLIFLLATTIQFFKISKKATYLMIPYILWASFATILNFWILLIN